MTERYWTNVDTKSLSEERKNELIVHLAKRVKRGDVQFSKKHKELVEALARVKFDKRTPDLSTVETIVLILAQVVWDALEKNKCKRFYVTEVTHNTVLGISHQNERDKI